MTARSPQVVLCVNTGSSSLKLALFAAGEAEQLLGGCSVAPVGAAQASARLVAGGQVSEQRGPCPTHERALDWGLGLLAGAALPQPTVAGHRVVHGGTEFRAPALVGAEQRRRLGELVPLAPLHLPAAIAGIDALSARWPGLPQVACFDTAFHATLPEHVRRLPVPGWLHDEGVMRYGFHGLSFEWALSRLGEPPPARVVMAHLGNGLSLAAVREGRSIDTTMAFTPAAGVIMSTRSGDLDPGVLLHVLRREGFGAAELERLVYRESGLLAVGGASDVRELLGRRASADGAAELALRMLVYQVQKTIGGFAVALGGLDALVFTGGIGENSAVIRGEIAAGLGSLGVALDAAANEAGASRIEASGSRCEVHVVAADEDRMIARHAAAAVG